MLRKKASLFEKRARCGYLFILPLILGVALIFLPNLIQTFIYSVSKIETMQFENMKFSGFASYKEAISKDPKFIPLLLSDLKSLVIHIPVILIYSLFIATLLNQEFKGRVLARIVFFVPVILSTGILATTDSTALYYTGSGQSIDTGTASGLASLADFSGMLSSLNFPDFLIKIVTDSVADIYTVATMSGLQIFVFLAGLQEIPVSMYEAAQTEGCSRWGLFWKITLPMITPQIAVNLVYTISVSAAEDNGILSYSNQLAFNENKYSLSTAMNVMYLLSLAAVVVIMFAVLSKSAPKEN